MNGARIRCASRHVGWLVLFFTILTACALVIIGEGNSVLVDILASICGALLGTWLALRAAGHE